MNVSIVYDDLEDVFRWWVADGPHAVSQGGDKNMAEAFGQAMEALSVAI